MRRLDVDRTTRNCIVGSIAWMRRRRPSSRRRAETRGISIGKVGISERVSGSLPATTIRFSSERKADSTDRWRTFVPEFHGDGRADWTFAVELVVPPIRLQRRPMTRSLPSCIPTRVNSRGKQHRRFEILSVSWMCRSTEDLDTRKPPQ